MIPRLPKILKNIWSISKTRRILYMQPCCNPQHLNFDRFKKIDRDNKTVEKRLVKPFVLFVGRSAEHCRPAEFFMYLSRKTREITKLRIPCKSALKDLHFNIQVCIDNFSSLIFKFIAKLMTTLALCYRFDPFVPGGNSPSVFNFPM